MSEELNNCRCGGKPEVERRVREGRDMTAEASPRPWTWDINDDDQLMLYDADGNPLGQLFDHGCESEANIIVDAVNKHDDLVENLKTANANRERENAEWVKLATELKAERDRLRDIVRRFLDLFTPGTIHPAGTMERLLRKARAAIGEDKE